MELKYGVIDINWLEEDIRTWKWMALAGRMAKPVKINKIF